MMTYVKIMYSTYAEPGLFRYSVLDPFPSPSPGCSAGIQYSHLGTLSRTVDVDNSRVQHPCPARAGSAIIHTCITSSSVGKWRKERNWLYLESVKDEAQLWYITFVDRAMG